MSDLPIPACPHCRYELKGLPLRGTCPECGGTYSLSLPGLQPGSMPPSSRYQRYAYDAGLDRRAIIRAAALSVTSVAIIAAWKAAAAKEDGPQEAVNFLIRFGISLGAALVVYIACMATGIIEPTGSLKRGAIGVTGALAAALLTQHITAEAVPALLGVPWLLGLIVFLGLAADLLELDFTEAALFAVFILGTRVMLKFTLFDHMFQ